VAKVVLENLYKTFPPAAQAQREPEAATASTDPAAGGSAVLRRINLTVADGEFMVLVGPSGCGKSTLLRIISGLEAATAGNIWVGDTRVNDLPPKQRDTAMVFQSYALYPHLTVYDNLAFGLRRMPLQPGEGHPTSVGEKGAVVADHSPETSAPTTVPATSGAQPTQVWWQVGLVGLTRRLPPGLRYRSPLERWVEGRVRSVARMLQIEPLLGAIPGNCLAVKSSG
jgi:multiple sugar transport system ATP-binding protein